MTEHQPNCASLRLLLSHPPQSQPCDCGLHGRAMTTPPQILLGPQPGNPGHPGPPPSAAARDQVGSLIKGGRVLAFPGCAAPVDAEIAGGAPLAPTPLPSMGDALRELARKVDAGELGDIRQFLCIPIDEMGTLLPHILGKDMTNVEVIGRLEICKANVLESLWVDID